MNKNRVLGIFLAGGLLAGLALIGCTGATTTEGAVSIWPLVVFVVLMIAAMYFLTVRPQQKRAKQQQELLTKLQKGEHVVTIGGIYGQVESVDENSVVLRIESGATIRVAKGAISGKAG